jgi:hypothetical protein
MNDLVPKTVIEIPKEALLGHLRTRPDITFQWIEPPLKNANYDIGRVYYPCFKLRKTGERKSSLYCVGDNVSMTTQHIKKPQVVRIVSVYQATKSYVGYPPDYDNDKPIEIQKRGT